MNAGLSGLTSLIEITGPAGNTLRGLLHRCGGAVLRGLLPGACALCGLASDDTLCADCAVQFFGPGAAIARCPRCANPLPGVAADGGAVAGDERAVADGQADGGSASTGQPGPAVIAGAATRAGTGGGPTLCGACIAEPPAFDVTLVATDYALPLDQLVLQLKFGHRLALATLFARLLRDSVLQHRDFVLPALLCPVPLGPRRLAERGYNQALEIARPLARSLGVALHPRLACRVHETAAQSGVAPDQRQRNIAGAFAIPDGALVQGRHVGIVDDVMTSGRTLNELAATLKRHGAVRVSNLVFARTPPR